MPTPSSLPGEREIRVYVAGPLSRDPLRGTHEAIGAATALFDRGVIPFVPHLCVLWETVAPRTYEDWMRFCFAWLRQCDAVLRLPGESSGADREVDLARSLGLPVFLDREAVFRWADARRGTSACLRCAAPGLSRLVGGLCDGVSGEDCPNRRADG